MKERKSFLVYGDIKAVVDELTDEQVAQLFRGMLAYFADGTEPDFSGILKFVFIPIKQQMDRDAEKYEKKCERNRKNIEKRWSREKDTTVYDGIRTYTNDTDTDTDKDTDKDRDTDTESATEADGSLSRENFIFFKDIY